MHLLIQNSKFFIYDQASNNKMHFNPSDTGGGGGGGGGEESRADPRKPFFLHNFWLV